MKTNFDSISHLVLISELGTVLGIIKCEAGIFDITEKLRHVISAFEECENLNFSFENYQADPHEYERLIATHDGTLAMLRDNWMKAPVGEKAKWMARLNDALDERFRLMQQRDEIPA